MKFSYLFVGLGGAAGAIARVALMRVLPPFFLHLPIKILVVNVIGCFAIGVLAEVMAFYWNASMNMKHFLVQGFLGGFTTFSAFALEYGLLQGKGSHLLAALYAVVSVIVSFASFFLGLKLIRLFT